MSNKNYKWYTDRYRTKIGVISTGTYYDIFVHTGLKVSSNYSIIYSDKSYLSIKYDGFVVVRKANRPHYMCLCLNIDLKTGKVIRLEDLVDIEKLKYKFIKDNFNDNLSLADIKR